MLLSVTFWWLECLSGAVRQWAYANPKAPSPGTAETEASTLFQFIWEAGEISWWPPQLRLWLIWMNLFMKLVTPAICLRMQLGSGEGKLLCVRSVGCHVVVLSTFVYSPNSRLCTISRAWAAGCDWDYSCVHVRSRFLLGLCVVGGLLNSAHNKFACQTRGKANTSDSGSIYILLCNTLDLSSTICL